MPGNHLEGKICHGVPVHISNQSMNASFRKDDYLPCRATKGVGHDNINVFDTLSLHELLEIHPVASVAVEICDQITIQFSYRLIDEVIASPTAAQDVAPLPSGDHICTGAARNGVST